MRRPLKTPRSEGATASQKRRQNNWQTSVNITPRHLQAADGFQNFAHVRRLAQFIDFRPSDVAGRVHDEDGAVVDEGNVVLDRREDAVGFGGFRVRPAIRRQRKLDASERFLKRDVGKNRVRVDAQDLGV